VGSRDKKGAALRFPFSAVLGQDDLRLALILNAVHPAVGGVLVRGEKGTAKSTMVRALAAVLPAVDAVPGCRFSCDPAAPDPACPDGPHGPHSGAEAATRPARLVELPIGASEDRLTGALDLERALGRGEAAFQPGLLAAAHRGLLYVDEVNLLPDHLVDVLLDAAAMGEAHVERDGVSVRHAARFLLVGTMNPEEGELRPQLLDRFGLTVDVVASREPRERAEVVRRRLGYEADPAGFCAQWSEADAEVGRRIAAAREALPKVALPDAELERIARICAAFEVDGMRADLVTARAAIALAAWRGLSAVTAEEVRDAARLALPHRRRRNPFDAPGLDQDQLDRAAEDPDNGPEDNGPNGDGGGGPGDGDDGGGASPSDGGNPESSGADNRPTAPRGSQAERDGSGQGSGTGPHDGSSRNDVEGGVPGKQSSASEQAAVGAGETFRTRLFAVPGVGEGVPGRRSAGRSPGRGRTVGSQKPEAGSSRGQVIHLPATLRAAAPHQVSRRRGAGRVVQLRAVDLRTAVRRDREGNLVLFAVDASGSMAARARMTAVKGAVLSLLLDAYQRRDKVGLVTFRGSGAEVALPPTGSVEAAALRLAALPTGGRTPLAAGLLAAYGVVRRERLRDPRRRALLVLVTDGRATGGSNALGDARRAAAFLAASGVASIVVDCETGPVRLGLAAEMADHLGGEHVLMGALSAEALDRTVRGATSMRKAA
jgi:magnesium chelatase subunit D